ncbi:MAG: glycosyltransferase family 1 protein [Proteobacteria bacterium]|uniref:CgeB family protein n=1 Tax=Aquabacterium sp. TaxID=1872578 RepID=UPI0035C70612|nr:glycosyltransferase family 1 protein [Pseudomonadota bacterium]
MTMKILYVGDDKPSSTSRHRADALRRLGHEVTHLNPYGDLRKHLNGWRIVIHYRSGYAFLQPRVRRWQAEHLNQLGHFDVCWVDGGELLGRQVVEGFRQAADKVVLFNHDDPTGHRDGMRFWTMLRAIPAYDLCVVVRPFNVDEYRQRGARDVLRVFMSYDEVRHAAPAQDGPVPPQFDNDIVFIGRNIPGEGRDLFLHELVKAGLKPAIWGDNWQASPVWAALQPFWKGPSISGSDYVNAMRHARICLGMLSKGNRDEHTTRSMEIPYAGGLLCAERTSEHTALYREGEEAVFWRDAAECAQVCRELLADPARIGRIKAAGHARVLANRVGAQDVGRAALARLTSQTESR